MSRGSRKFVLNVLFVSEVAQFWLESIVKFNTVVTLAMGRQTGRNQNKHNNITSISMNGLVFRVYHKQLFTSKVMDVYD